MKRESLTSGEVGVRDRDERVLERLQVDHDLALIAANGDVDGLDLIAVQRSADRHGVALPRVSALGQVDDDRRDRLLVALLETGTDVEEIQLRTGRGGLDAQRAIAVIADPSQTRRCS